MKIKKHLPFILASIVVLLQFAFVSFMVLKRVGAFGCFDDCHNFVTGYFMLKGREMYREIFYNHQMIMPFISYTIQLLTSPETLYSLVQYHRLAIIGMSFLATVALAVRFRWRGLLFSLLYEPLKFYFLGDRFLPEALIAYLMAYLIGIVWESMETKKLSTIDAIISAGVTWLVIFLREPYVPAAIFLFGSMMVLHFKERTSKMSIAIFVFLCATTVLLVPVSDYLFTVVTVNRETVLTLETSSNNILGSGMFAILFYPLYVLLHIPESLPGKWLYALSLMYIGLLLWNATHKKHIAFMAISFLGLAMAAVRYVEPGATFYEAFHMLPWVGLFVMVISLLSYDMFVRYKHAARYLAVAGLTGIWTFSISYPTSFLYENINTFEEFNDGYAHYQRSGDIIEKLSDDNDRVFVELWDDILYWQTGLDSSYQYALYTPLMEPFPRYANARSEMFAEYPPEFYYCSDGYNYQPHQLIPETHARNYIQLLENSEPLCIFVHTEKLKEITEEQWQSVQILGVTLPSELP